MGALLHVGAAFLGHAHQYDRIFRWHHEGGHHGATFVDRWVANIQQSWQPIETSTSRSNDPGECWLYAGGSVRAFVSCCCAFDADDSKNANDHFVAKLCYVLKLQPLSARWH